MDTPKPPTTKAEPRWLTVPDVMAVVLGVAIGLAWQDFTPRLRPATTPTGIEFYSLFLLVIGPVRTLALAAALAAIYRCIRYERLPFPGEWIVLVVCLGGVSESVLAASALTRVSTVAPRYDPDVDAWQWVSPTLTSRGLASEALLGLAGAAAFALALSPIRDRPWAKTILLAALVLALLLGPLAAARVKLWSYRIQAQADVIRLRLPMVAAGDSPEGHWTLSAQNLIGLGFVPEGLVFAIPVMATLRRTLARSRTRWVWIEPTGLLVAGVLASSWLVDGYLITIRKTVDTPMPELLIRGIWLFLVAALAWLIAGRLAPAWQRWVRRPEIRSNPNPDIPTLP